MATGIANGYYLKALDNYPYCLPEFLESINYALAYDDAHADAHCLMGVFYMDQLQKFNDAIFHFDKALEADVFNIQTYYNYIRLTIVTDEVEKAYEMINFASTIKGVDKPTLLHLEAILHEKSEEYQLGIDCLDLAVKLELSNDRITFYQSEKNRIREKLKTSLKVIYTYNSVEQF